LRTDYVYGNVDTLVLCWPYELGQSNERGKKWVLAGDVGDWNIRTNSWLQANQKDKGRFVYACTAGYC